MGREKPCHRKQNQQTNKHSGRLLVPADLFYSILSYRTTQDKIRTDYLPLSAGSARRNRQFEWNGVLPPYCMLDFLLKKIQHSMPQIRYNKNTH
mmetsp:Transcript_7344/g.15718  ORF Transcript_7344/g.15718 Transcript_7344/m.15718 type:complete len:94 (-) Transcript_7344:280-561(-)